jgi:hypothetical protein
VLGFRLDRDASLLDPVSCLLSFFAAPRELGAIEKVCGCLAAFIYSMAEYMKYI